jgi:glycosyltransferase involved in cell wall biosynthesis
MLSASKSEVTVVIPAMNRAHLLPRALESVKRQTVAPFEVLVVDDASSDSTADVAREGGARVVSMPQRSGSGPARNAGIAAAQTEWIAFLDSDDEWDAEHLELLLLAAHGRDDHVLVCAPAQTSSGRAIGNVTGRLLELTPARLLVPGDAIVTSGTMARRSVLEAVGGFRALPRAQDLDLWLRVLERGPGLATTSPTVHYHEHPGQASTDADLMRACFELIIADYSDRPWLTSRVRTASYGRVIWDDLRKGQRARDWRLAGRSALWLVTHPWAWTAVLRLLRQRRQSRVRGAESAAASASGPG